jgi:lysine 2,3-aminomutase
MQEAIKLTQEHLNTDQSSNYLMNKWTDWRWQIKNTIRKVDTVEKIMGIKFSDEKKKEINETIEKFPMAITPYYLSLVDEDDFETDPVFKQCFPSIDELLISPIDMKDPLHEDKDSPVCGITHRYPDRVLFHVSNVCAMYCRHCTRKRKVGDVDSVPSDEMITAGIDYIKNTPTVRDVLLSGGDPFCPTKSWTISSALLPQFPMLKLFVLALALRLFFPIGLPTT